MKIGAYVLAADPTWVATSIRAYYDYVDEIVVSYDRTNRGWSGGAIQAPLCLARIRAVDKQGKVTMRDGAFVNPGLSPMAAETAQRADALRQFSPEIDWVLQLDTDEVIPSITKLIAAIHDADNQGASAVEWPMRVLYRQMRNGSYLEVSERNGNLHSEYPGPVAVRRSAMLVHARIAEGQFVRYCVPGDTSLQLSRPPAENEVRIASLTPEDVIWHNSWARSPRAVWSKVRSWGHAEGLKTTVYYAGTWLPAPWRWRRMRNFHPFSDGLWPALRRVETLPFDLSPEDQ